MCGRSWERREGLQQLVKKKTEGGAGNYIGALMYKLAGSHGSLQT